ncbi:hypothetical protein ACH4VM_36710 [Streptomyces sp. NPDC020792]|uniref:hypothetical protein n=1 Tax=Streptomyces sp. NPDC020792 TaxID=3365089 RepID=UPI00379FBAFB
MIAAARVCQACREDITDPDDAVYLGHEEGNSGSGWEIFAHRAHVDQVQPDPVAERALARLLIARAFES